MSNCIYRVVLETGTLNPRKFDSINNRCGNVLDENNWLENESPELRKAIGLTAKKKEWFKRQDYAQELGELIMGKYELLDTDCRTKHEIDGLIQWIIS